jgi:transposase
VNCERPRGLDRLAQQLKADLAAQPAPAPSWMSSRGPKAVAIELSVAEREQLESWASRRRAAAGLAIRARIVLATAKGESTTSITKQLRISIATARRWRSRFSERRLDRLVDEPQPVQPRKITDQKVGEVIVKTLESAPPDGGTHWSTRQMAQAVGLNQTAISRIWRAFGLQPHRVEHWKLSKDPPPGGSEVPAHA